MYMNLRCNTESLEPGYVVMFIKYETLLRCLCLCVSLELLALSCLVREVHLIGKSYCCFLPGQARVITKQADILNSWYRACFLESVLELVLMC